MAKNIIYEIKEDLINSLRYNSETKKMEKVKVPRFIVWKVVVEKFKDGEEIPWMSKPHSYHSTRELAEEAKKDLEWRNGINL